VSGWRNFFKKTREKERNTHERERETNTAYCIWIVISSFSNLNRWSNSLRLFYHVPLKRDQGDWDWRLRLNDTPNTIGCICLWQWDMYFVRDKNTREEERKTHEREREKYMSVTMRHVFRSWQKQTREKKKNTWERNTCLWQWDLYFVRDKNTRAKERKTHERVTSSVSHALMHQKNSLPQWVTT